MCRLNKTTVQPIQLVGSAIGLVIALAVAMLVEARGSTARVFVGGPLRECGLFRSSGWVGVKNPDCSYSLIAKQ